MYQTYSKGKPGRISGYKNFSGVGQLENKNVGFRESQGVFAHDDEAERMDQYGDTGTSAKARQSEPYETSRPLSRYRSRFP